MSESSGNSPLSNGTSSNAQDPLQRLSSFKTPRDLSLGGIKPNKKVFTPNLNVARNKNKGSLPIVTRDKKDNDKGRRDRNNDRNRNVRNGPNVIKSSGVFSEGMGAAERRSVRSSFARDVEATPTLQKPTIRVKDVWKIDKELEQNNINKVMGASDEQSDDDITTPLDKMAPVSLPISDGGWLHSKPKVTVKVKPEVMVKKEPLDLEMMPPVDEKKPIIDLKKEVYEDMDIVSLLRNDKPTLIMLQFPDSLPGRGCSTDDEAPRKAANSDLTKEPDQDKPMDNRCRLQDLEEGKVGKLLIHRSGRVRLALGDTMFEVSAGTQASFRQEVVSVATDPGSRSASLVALGPAPRKLQLIPHWETLLADVAG